MSFATYVFSLYCKTNIFCSWISFLLVQNNTESRESLCSWPIFPVLRCCCVDLLRDTQLFCTLRDSTGELLMYQCIILNQEPYISQKGG